jgi:hypothetical protein
MIDPTRLRGLTQEEMMFGKRPARLVKMNLIVSAVAGLVMLGSGKPAFASEQTTYCQYYTLQEGHMLTESWSAGDYLYVGTIVVHVPDTISGRHYGITVANTGDRGWWGGTLRRTSANCWS